MDQTNAANLAIATLNLPVFNSFPYLITRLAPAFYHAILLPANPWVEELQSLARHQASANDLDTCLVLGYGRCIYFYADGTAQDSDHIPRGGIIVHGKLKPAEEFFLTENLARREHLLGEYAESRNPKDAYVHGDLTKGGQDATSEEAARLSGKQENGVPLGLSRCPACRHWKGKCLDPSPQFQGKVMQVHCRCDNRNLCARCGNRLAKDKLNANYYSEADGQIWHVPGFCGLNHRCEEQRTWLA